MSFTEELAVVFNKYGLTSNVGFLLIPYEKLLSERSTQDFLTVPAEYENRLRHLAEYHLKNEQLSEEERIWLLGIEGGNLPPPFKYGAECTTKEVSTLVEEGESYEW